MTQHSFKIDKMEIKFSRGFTDRRCERRSASHFTNIVTLFTRDFSLSLTLSNRNLDRLTLESVGRVTSMRLLVMAV